ncbi:hypothetical protein CF319_g4813 [Tilletia indica]|nr:hypothetical protein CF319_g4813 [Tilletia indica]
MTRYTKLEGRKAATTRPATTLFDDAHDPLTPATKRTAPTTASDDDDADDTTPSKRRKVAQQPATPTAPTPPLTKEAKLKRIKLLKLKAKKSKSEEKKKSLFAEMSRLEREIGTEAGRWKDGYDKASGPNKSSNNNSTFDWPSSTTSNETNPWKVMEAERRAKTDSRRENRREKRIDERQSNTTCFACRATGHAARDCPNTLNAHTSSLSSSTTTKTKGKEVVGLCFRCGSNTHTLARCKVAPKGRKTDDDEEELPFATCFVCSGTGHLASGCPKNAERGVFPMGGAACAVCKSVRHRAKDCPEGKAKEEGGERGEPEIEVDGAARRVGGKKSKTGAGDAGVMPARKKVVNF